MRVMCLKCQRCQRKSGGQKSTFVKTYMSNHETASLALFNFPLNMRQWLYFPSFHSFQFLLPSFFIISCTAPTYRFPSPLPPFIYSLFLCISFSLPQFFPVINITICASTNAAQNVLLMPQMLLCQIVWVKCIKAHLWSFILTLSKKSSESTGSTCFKEWPSLSRNLKQKHKSDELLSPPSTPPPFN